MSRRSEIIHGLLWQHRQEWHLKQTDEMPGWMKGKLVKKKKK